MAIKTYTCHNALCDVCGEELDDGDGVRHFTSPEDALDYVRDLDCWWVGDDFTVVCESRTEDHVAKAHEIARTLTSTIAVDRFTKMWPDIVVEFGPRFDTYMPGQVAIVAEQISGGAR